MTFADRRLRIASALGVGLASLGIYACTLGSAPYWQDSGLFLAGLNVGGGLAPNGYPLYLLLARPFVWVLMALGAEFTVAAHLFSAVWGAATAVLATLTIQLLSTSRIGWYSAAPPDEASPLSGTAHALCAAGGLAVGWSYSLWFQSLTAEVYSLNAATAMGLLYIIVRLGAEGPLRGRPTVRQVGWLTAGAVVFGLSFANHLSTVVLVPAVWLWVAMHYRVTSGWLPVGLLSAFFCCGFLPYLYLPIYANVEPLAQFGWVKEWDGFWAHLRGARWTGQGSSWGWSTDRLAALPGQLWDELFLWGVVGAGVGARAWWTWNPRAALFVGVYALVGLGLPFIYLQGTEYDFWFLPLFGLLQVTAAWGWVRVWQEWGERVPAAWRWPAVGAVAAIALLPQLLVNWQYCDRRDYFVAEDFGRGLLRDVEPGALFFAWSDQECSLSRYVHEVRGVRPDVFVLQAPVLPDSWYPDWMRARYPALQVPEPPPGQAWTDVEWAMQLAWANRPRPTYGSRKLAALKLPSGAGWVPVGGLWKLVWAGAEQARIDPRHWTLPYRNPDPFDRPTRAHHAMRRSAQSRDLTDVERLPHQEEVRRFHEQAWLNRARWHLDHAEHALAVEAFFELLREPRRARPPGLWFEAGQTAFIAGRADVAGVWLSRVPDDFPYAPQRSLYLGQLAADRQDWATAQSHYAFVRTRAPALWAEAEAGLRSAGLLPR